jgi:hypothetical protein
MQAERGSADLNFNFALNLSAAKAAWTKAGEGKRKIGKVENRETEIRIEQGRGGKDETLESGKEENWHRQLPSL